MVVPELPPPLSLIAIIAIIIVYIIICYLVIDLIGHCEDARYQVSQSDDGCYSGISIEELQAMAFCYRLGASPASCVICLESLQRAELCRVFPACNHVFHAHCIDPWLATRSTCPICRTPFNLARDLKSCYRR